MRSTVPFLLLFSTILVNDVSSEYCYYREAKEGRKHYLECEFFGRDQPVEGISLIHLKHNTTIPVIEKDLISPFKNLKTLYITAANVDRIEPGALHNYKLAMVDLYHNNLRAIENGTFSSQSALETLDMSYNKFETLESSTFVGLVALQWLSLNSNQIKSIDKASFRPLKSLRALHMRFNKIERLDTVIFDNLILLELLDLSYNSLTKTEIGLFSELRQLKTLEMKHNYLESLPDRMFNNLSSLTVLDLSQNKISELQENLFYRTHELEILNFSSNNMSWFNATSLLIHAPKLQEVHLYFNQWKCNQLNKTLDDFAENQVLIPTSTPVLNSEIRGIGCNK